MATNTNQPLMEAIASHVIQPEPEGKENNNCLLFLRRHSKRQAKDHCYSYQSGSCPTALPMRSRIGGNATHLNDAYKQRLEQFATLQEL